MPKVNFLGNINDLRVLVLGSLGFSTDYITKRTSLSHGQIGYRLRKGKVKRTDYRNGGSHYAKYVLRQAEVRVAKGIRQKLEAIRAKLHNHELAVQRSNMKAFLEGVKIGQRMKEKEAKQHAKGARVS